MRNDKKKENSPGLNNTESSQRKMERTEHEARLY